MPLYHAVVALPATAMPDLSSFILDMHGRNGLLALSRSRDAKPLGAVDYELSNLIPNEADSERKAVLAGAFVHFDHDFLKFHLPKTSARLSHRHYDVLAVKLFCRSVGMPTIPKSSADDHRAFVGVREALADASACRDFVCSFDARK